jgi:hypothetical protein
VPDYKPASKEEFSSRSQPVVDLIGGKLLCRVRSRHRRRNRRSQPLLEQGDWTGRKRCALNSQTRMAP